MLDGPCHSSREYPAKVILLGEYAVLRGHPLIGMALPKYTCAVTISNRSTKALADEKTVKAFEYILRCFGVQRNWCIAKVESSIPENCGLGSSAALCLALVDCAAKAAKKDLTREDHFSIAKGAEEVLAGMPSSGADLAIILHRQQGPCIFYPETEDSDAFTEDYELDIPEFTVLRIDGLKRKKVNVSEVIIPENYFLLEKMGQIVRDAVLNGISGDHFRRYHECLRQLGTSHQTIDEILKTNIGKMTGGGSGGAFIIEGNRCTCPCTTISLFPHPPSCGFLSSE